MTLGVLPFFRIRLRKSDSWFRDGFQVLLFFWYCRGEFHETKSVRPPDENICELLGCIYFLTVERMFPFEPRIKVPSKGASKPRTKFVAKEEPRMLDSKPDADSFPVWSKLGLNL